MKRLKLGLAAVVAVLGVAGAYASASKATFGPNLYSADEAIHPSTSQPIYILKLAIPNETNPADYTCELDATVCTVSLFSAGSVKTLPDGRKYVLQSEAAVIEDNGTYVAAP